MNTTALLLTIAAAAVLLIVMVTLAARSPRFAIKQVVVSSPLTKVDPSFVERIVRKEFAGTYFTLNVRKAQAALTRVPWVKSVSIRRVWPRALDVKIVEHTAFARWNADALISEDAVVFAGQTKEVLPQLNGPDGSEANVVDKYKKAQAALAPLGYSVRVMTLSPSFSLSAELKEGPSVHFGREQFETRLARLVEFGASIRSKVGVSIDSLDLRYSRGVAVAMNASELARATALNAAATAAAATARESEKKQP
jgi:cell division protein FtsQ